MGIEEVAEIVRKIAEGFEDACVRCLDDNKDIVLESVREQLKSGLDGEGKHLSPTYDDDPFFQEKGIWYNRTDDYKKWKRSIEVKVDNILNLPLRPDNVPNLYINGKFYSDIGAERHGSILTLDSGPDNGPDIISKYGDQILNIGPTAIEYFNTNYLVPAIESFFNDCGYK